MWISRQFSKSVKEPTVQSGKSTLNGAGGVEAVSTGTERNLDIYAPYGYCFSLPAKSDILLTKYDGTQAGTGVLMEERGLENGEIEIHSLSGAYIKLKNDGSVEINGLTVGRNGEIE